MTSLAQFFGGGGSAVDSGSILVSAGGDYVPVDTDDVRLGTTFGDQSSQTGTLVVTGGGGSDYSAQLDRIEARTNLISAGKIRVTSPVTEGGSIVLYKGSDYRERQNTAIKVPVPDVGGTLRAILKDNTKVESIIFGSGEKTASGEHFNEVVGTVDISAIAVDPEDADITNIFVEITKEQLADATETKHEYHIKAIAPVVGSEANGDEVVKLVGDLQVRPKRAEPIA